MVRNDRVDGAHRCNAAVWTSAKSNCPTMAAVRRKEPVGVSGRTHADGHQADLASAAGKASNVGEPWDCGQTHCHPPLHDGNDRSLSARKTLIDPQLT